jgi:Rrf2 family protein
MKLSRASSYALAYLAHLAREKPDKPVPSHEVARELDLPEWFLLKVLTPRVSMGILGSVKGPKGGYSLARPPKDITLLEVADWGHPGSDRDIESRIVPERRGRN